MRYDIRRMARQKRRYKSGDAVRLPAVAASASAEREYRAGLRRALRELATIVREDVLVSYADHRRVRRLLGDAARVELTDAPDWFVRLRAKVRELQTDLAGMVSRVLDLEGKRNTKGFHEAARRALGIDLQGVVTDEDLREALLDANARNVALIRDLTDNTYRRIERAVYDAKMRGESVEQLRKTLREQFKFSANRADLIASDQIGKINGDFNRLRHQQAGITKYTWQTSRDERVRRRHRRLDGIEYKYGSPTGAEEGLPPGQPIRCRCVAIATVEF